MEDNYFIKQIDINEPVETVFGWHEKPGAFERLTPPWMKLKNIQKTGNGIETGAKINMDICFSGIPVPIKAEHIGYEKNRFFKDRLSGGLFSKWEHTHAFSSSRYSSGTSDMPFGTSNISSGSNGFSRLEDRIDYRLPFHIPEKWHGFIHAELYRLFNYRHMVMITDLEHHKNCLKPLTILISGASGPVGNALIPFLTTGGHRVIKLVRSKPQTDDEIQWNPYTKELDLKQTDKINVVINLNGYHIGSGRWTDKRKELIIQSRNLSTTLLADRIAALPANLRPEL
ncbi:MAG: TIGR01777 family protein, partial [Desulfamplus sp.]|nr:TIGR01777 family protein [Desulfamplus sp.]